MAQCQPHIAGTFIAKVIKGEQVLLKKGNQTPVVRGKIVCNANRQKHQNSVANANYWSSTENNATNAFNFNFNFDNGNQNNNNKNNTNRVRAVRDFKQAIFSENLSASAKALIVFSFLKNIKLYKLICATFIIRHTTTQN